jgi:ABC-type uncharacterized transport system substrate-binding protein
MAIQIGRRHFIAALGSAAIARPLAAPAQQSAVPTIGFLNSGSPGPFAQLVAAFRQGLSESGYVERQNLAIEYRWAEGAYDQLPGLATDLVHRRVDVIFAGGPPAAVAAKAATTTIPIVFASGGNPVELGLVSSLNQPGGNITGVSFLINELVAKRLELLRELVPAATSIGLLANMTRPSSGAEVRAAQQAVQTLGASLYVQSASSAGEIDAAFANFTLHRINAVMIGSDPFFNTRRDQVVALATRLAIPTMYNLREYVAAGGLISYAPSLADVYRQAGVYTGKILKGAKPADLPVMQPTTFELVINLKAAKALGLTVPLIMQMTANEVIE